MISELSQQREAHYNVGLLELNLEIALNQRPF
jgi:hypothetical protein